MKGFWLLWSYVCLLIFPVNSTYLETWKWWLSSLSSSGRSFESADTVQMRINMMSRAVPQCQILVETDSDVSKKILFGLQEWVGKLTSSHNAHLLISQTIEFETFLFQHSSQCVLQIDPSDVLIRRSDGFQRSGNINRIENFHHSEIHIFKVLLYIFIQYSLCEISQLWLKKLLTLSTRSMFIVFVFPEWLNRFLRIQIRPNFSVK